MKVLYANPGLEMDWIGRMDYGMEYGILKKVTFFIAIDTQLYCVAISLLTYS